MKRLVLLLAGCVLSSVAGAAEFRSVAESGAILYDAPSVQASKRFVAGRGLPLEVISTDGTWVKVRDRAGDLTWIERKALSERRTVVVRVPLARVRANPDVHSPVVFEAQQGVILELQEASTTGWLRVRHADGSGGYVHLDDVWGG